MERQSTHPLANAQSKPKFAIRFELNRLSDPVKAQADARGRQPLEAMHWALDIAERTGPYISLLPDPGDLPGAQQHDGLWRNSNGVWAVISPSKAVLLNADWSEAKSLARQQQQQQQDASLLLIRLFRRRKVTGADGSVQRCGESPWSFIGHGSIASAVQAKLQGVAQEDKAAQGAMLVKQALGGVHEGRTWMSARQNAEQRREKAAA